jgi:hypothetical protein
MAVRTDVAGIKNKRKVGVKSALPSVGASRGKKTLPRDEAAALRREINRERATPGPAAKKAKAKSGRTPTTVQGRKKAPSRMNVKSKGGPRKSTRLHGG